jgi:hypothetical protein
MSTLDEITKEKQRVGEALVRVDAQREQLVSQLRELEATSVCPRSAVITAGCSAPTPTTTLSASGSEDHLHRQAVKQRGVFFVYRRLDTLDPRAKPRQREG